MQLINSMDLIKRRINPALDVLGVVMTMYDARTRLSADVVENVRRHFPRHIFEAIIPRSVRLAEAPSYGQTIVEYAPNSSGAEAYRALANEVAGRLELERGMRAHGILSSHEVVSIPSGNGN
jgi:chromosome partitioning protein